MFSFFSFNNNGFKDRYSYVPDEVLFIHLITTFIQTHLIQAITNLKIKTVVMS